VEAAAVRRIELAETLQALVAALQPPEASGVVITDAELDVPLEVLTGERQGKLVFYAAVPHTRWVTGVLPTTHLSKLRIELVEGHGR
jgi:hypothetical protein